jgi:uncharacterized protein (DUF2384 family)
LWKLAEIPAAAVDLQGSQEAGEEWLSTPQNPDQRQEDTREQSCVKIRDMNSRPIRRDCE